MSDDEHGKTASRLPQGQGGGHSIRQATGPPARLLFAAFRRIDWFNSRVTTLVVWRAITYAGPRPGALKIRRMAVGSFYAGIPHPTGYPIATISPGLDYHSRSRTFARARGLSQTVAGAVASGLLGLLV